MFSIPEKIFLLSLYEKRNGSIQLSKSPYLSYGLISGSLIELVLSRSAVINSSRKFIVINPAVDIQVIPEDLIRQIMYEKSGKKAAFWMEALGRKRKRVEEEFLAVFLAKNVLVLDGQVCHFHPDHATSPTSKYTIKEEIRAQILGGEELDPKTLVILKIMNSVHMLDQIFTADEIKPIHVFIDQVKRSDFQFFDDVQIADSILGILEALNQVINENRD